MVLGTISERWCAAAREGLQDAAYQELDEVYPTVHVRLAFAFVRALGPHTS